MVDFAYPPTTLLHVSCCPLLLNGWRFTQQSADSCLSAFGRAVPSAQELSPSYLTHPENYCSSLKISPGLLMQSRLPAPF